MANAFFPHTRRTPLRFCWQLASAMSFLASKL